MPGFVFDLGDSEQSIATSKVAREVGRLNALDQRRRSRKKPITAAINVTKPAINATLTSTFIIVPLAV
jgi:hypothetical protein